MAYFGLQKPAFRSIDEATDTDVRTPEVPPEPLLNPDEQHSYRAICGQLNWLATQSRPDIAYDVCKLSTKLNEARMLDVLEANKTLKKIKANVVDLKFKKLKPPLKIDCLL